MCVSETIFSLFICRSYMKILLITFYGNWKYGNTLKFEKVTLGVFQPPILHLNGFCILTQHVYGHNRFLNVIHVDAILASGGLLQWLFCYWNDQNYNFIKYVNKGTRSTPYYLSGMGIIPRLETPSFLSKSFNPFIWSLCEVQLCIEIRW